MTTDWATIRQRYANTYGEHPRAHDETIIIDLFEQTPTLVLRELDNIAALVQRGDVRHGWSFLAARLQQGAQPTRNPTIETGNERQRRVTNAEQWIRTAGLHYDRWTEVEHELFGSSEGAIDRNGEQIPTSGYAPLAAYENDQDLRERMRDIWLEHRPRGERTEREAEERARKHVQDRKRAANIKPTPALTGAQNQPSHNPADDLPL